MPNTESRYDSVQIAIGDTLINDDAVFLGNLQALINPIPASLTLEYIVVAGGGAGAYTGTLGGRGGGGGAGGYRSSINGENSGGGQSAETPITLLRNSAYKLTVGAGGVLNGSGSNSVLASITSIGGGGGGTYETSGGTGGSGGGAGANGKPAAEIPGASGSFAQGFQGGSTPIAFVNGASGGGGAAAVGQFPYFINDNYYGGDGGVGVQSNVTGTPTYRAGGGGGYGGGVGGAGGNGGGGTGGAGGGSATAGTTNTGGGSGGESSGNGEAGGSGVIILKYPLKYTATFSVGVTQTTSLIGDNKVSIVTTAGASDTVTFN